MTDSNASAAQILTSLADESTHASLTEEQLTAVVDVLNASDLSADNLDAVLNLIGNIARQADARKKLTPLDWEKTVAKILAGDGPARTKCLAARALGNLCYVNEDARAKALAEKMIEPLCQMLRTAGSNVDQTRNTAGALANLASDNETIQQQLQAAGMAPLLVELIEHPVEIVRMMALRALANLVENNEAAKEVAQLRILPRVCKQAEGEGAPTDAALSLLQALGEHQELVETFNEQNALDLIVDVYPRLQERLRADALRAVAHASAHDACLDNFFRHLPFFLAQLETNNADIMTAATMILGNIARRDDTCVKLVQGGILDKLLLLLSHSDERLIHLALGGIRNLAIPAANKPSVAATGVLPRCNELLKHRNALIQYGAVGIIKVMVNGGEQYAQQWMANPQGLQELAALVIRGPGGENEMVAGGERVQYEGARILVSLVSAQKEWAAQVAENRGVEALQVLLKSPFLLLQFEAIKAYFRLADLFAHTHADVAAALKTYIDAVATLATTCATTGSELRSSAGGQQLPAGVDGQAVTLALLLLLEMHHESLAAALAPHGDKLRAAAATASEQSRQMIEKLLAKMPAADAGSSSNATPADAAAS